MPTELHSDDVRVPSGTAAPPRTLFVVPLVVLVALVGSTLVAGVYRLTLHPALDELIQSIPAPLFLSVSIGFSGAVCWILHRTLQSRERRLRRLVAHQAELERANVRLASSAQTQSAEINERVRELEQSRTAMISLLEDLTESRDRIEEAKLFSDAIVSNVGDGLIVTSADGRVLRVNDRFVAMTGHPSPDAFLGAFIGDFATFQLSGESIPFAERPFMKIIDSGGTSGVIRNRGKFQKPDGAWLEFEVTQSPIVRDGSLTGVVGLVRDIAEELRIDREKSEFVSLASHQLRTPLTAISWYAELLLADAAQKLSSQQKEYLDEVYRANRRMIELVDALLNVSRIEMGTISIQPAQMDLRGFLKDQVRLFAPVIASKHLAVSTEIAPGINTYHADQKIMGIIIQNLVSNAVKYTLDGGRVVLRLTEEGGAIVLSVADNGIGIPRAVQGQVFKKLFRADNAQLTETDGSGLGLYLVKSIIDQIGGEIGFTSELGHGSTFTIRLPASGMKAIPGERALSAVTPSAGPPGITVSAMKH